MTTDQRKWTDRETVRLVAALDDLYLADVLSKARWLTYRRKLTDNSPRFGSVSAEMGEGAGTPWTPQDQGSPGLRV